MTSAADTLSGKSHRDENFPVASWLMSARNRGPILAFYRFARAADDVADHATLPPARKLALLDDLGAALTGEGPSDPQAEPLRHALRERGLSVRHALELLDAFRLDVRQNRYADWDELIGYCRLSAMPVGRFVLDVHGESEATWPASDALCAALQVINHLQDCGADYRDLGRIYLPQDVLAAHGATADMLAAPRAAPPLHGALGELARRASELVGQSRSLVPQIRDLRLSLEIGAIHNLARHLAGELERRDPLSEPVHLGKAGFALVGGAGVLQGLLAQLGRTIAARAGRRP
ncbi:squalene synthase HpnC [Chelatococcus reniformis]|uniref:Squalene synthase HpnC n=1 Tax=Chelatococcus reniformis TaxID=1494448 RepID=A0A916U642_9HYPH|nr:squalene synthase HpnC [Chelatococcus reniformis]GGC62131.1 squalene synthase HpnC [Chelatococcus reniformis]